jgi:hypothetical protein
LFVDNNTRESRRKTQQVTVTRSQDISLTYYSYNCKNNWNMKLRAVPLTLPTNNEILRYESNEMLQDLFAKLQNSMKEIKDLN